LPDGASIFGKAKLDFGKDEIFSSLFNLISTVHGVVFAFFLLRPLTRREVKELPLPAAGSIPVIPAPRRGR
jgi:hypothetical protein